MARRLLDAMNLQKSGGKRQPATARGTNFEFEADVPETGATLDFDVKTTGT
jgi:hypothetical protein